MGAMTMRLPKYDDAPAMAYSENVVGQVASRTIVAIILYRGRHMGLFRRSGSVGHDAGLWHCITGYLDSGVTPAEQAHIELAEEAGLKAQDIDALVPCTELDLSDRAGRLWKVHTFCAQTRCRLLRLNWEHDAYRWVQPQRLHFVTDRVEWLNDVMQAVTSRTDIATVP